MREGDLDVPLMEEEVLVVKEGAVMSFNFHRSLYERLVKPLLSILQPRCVEERGERVVLRLEGERGEEFKAWLLINLDKGFYITELESIELK